MRRDDALVGLNRRCWFAPVHLHSELFSGDSNPRLFTGFGVHICRSAPWSAVVSLVVAFNCLVSFSVIRLRKKILIQAFNKFKFQ